MISLHSPFKKIATVLLAAWTLLMPVLEAQVSSRLSSRFLARGERAILEVGIIGNRPDASPEIVPIEGVKIQPSGRGPQTQLIPGRRIEHVYSYILSSYEVGKHRIAPIRVQVGDDTFMTEAIDFSVFNPDKLNWSTAVAGRTEFRYACTFQVLSDQPYVNQAVPVEIKLFVPRDLFVIDWGIPDFERDGLTAWRMQPRDMRSEINLLGMPYISVAYPSTLTPNREGKVSIGPASIRLISSQVVMDGILRRQAVESRVQVPQLKLNAKQLPPNAPSGFENAVGNFRIQVNSGETEVQEGDPIALDLLVSGSGNLDTLRAPQPVSPLGWKVYEPTRQERGDERRELNGSVAFQQFLRPLEFKTAIPAYRLVFFNPESGKYESVQTEPIALQMTPATSATAPIGPPPQRKMPIEQMTDILGLIPDASLTRQSGPVISQWWLHGLAAMLAGALILRALWIRLQPRLASDPMRRQRFRELREIEALQDSDRQFLMAAGRFAERWLGEHAPEDVRDIIEERDAKCFRSDNENIKLDTQRRRSILSKLRKHASSWLLMACCLYMATDQLHAENANEVAAKAYASARYDQAIKTWLDAAPYSELSADTLYHVGNACYRAGSPGYAALYYRRAIERDSRHIEARQNLRFIERKYGSLTIKRPEHQHLLARLPLEAWQTTTWAGLWLCVLGVLCFPATRRGARLRYLAVTAIIVAPLLSVGGGLGWRYFPSDATFAPVTKQAVIVHPQSTLHSEASRNSSVIIETPPGSLCEILYESGEWSYVSFTTQTRGWLPSANIERIMPEQEPEIPEIRKPVADETSA